jgi:hypothetical protein
VREVAGAERCGRREGEVRGTEGRRARRDETSEEEREEERGGEREGGGER